MDLRHFKSGAQPQGMTTLNELVDRSNSGNELRGDEKYIAVRKTPTGQTISFNDSQIRALIPKFVPSFFPVRLQQNGGDAGSASAMCSFTYDVYALDNETQISDDPVDPGDGGSPCRAFPMMVTSPADYGQAFYDNDGSLQIMWCNESSGSIKDCG